MIVFALGGFTCIISILRLQSLLVFLQTTDFSYHNPLAAIWSSLEVNIGILCSCLPTLKAMIGRWFPRAFGSSYGLQGSDHSHERRNGANPGYGEGNKNTAGASSSGSSNPSGTDRYKTSSPFSFDALCRGPGREPATQKTTVHSERSEQHERERGQRRLWHRHGNNDDSLEDIEFGALRDSNRNVAELEEQHGIQVVTVVEQEVEKGYAGGSGDAKSEEGSERELVGSGGRKGRYA